MTDLTVRFGIIKCPWYNGHYNVTCIMTYIINDNTYIGWQTRRCKVFEHYEQICYILNIRRYIFRQQARRYGARVIYDKHIRKFSVTFSSKKQARRFIKEYLAGIVLIYLLNADWSNAIYAIRYW